MKKQLLFLFAFLLPLLGKADPIEIDGIWYYLVTKAKIAEVVNDPNATDYRGNYSGYKSITIPATVSYEGVTYDVTSIGDYAFACTPPNAPLRSSTAGPSSITIPESVTSIGEGAFYGCGNLTAITIPENSQVTSIGDAAFESCSKLTAITIPEGVTSIGSSAFYMCGNLNAVYISNINAWLNIKFSEYNSNPLCNASNFYLNGELVTELAIPESITNIGKYAFYGCKSLKNVTIPKSSLLNTIGYGAFKNCSNLNAVHISDIETWCKITFSDASSNPLYHAKNLYLSRELITELNIPQSITNIGNYVFSGCKSVTLITIPKSVTSIGNHAFNDCSNLTTINIPESVTSIGYRAFYRCSKLATVTITEESQLTSIGYAAFESCSKLTDITIPCGVTSIGEYAFFSCKKLSSITCYAATPPTIGGVSTFYSVDKSIPVYVPDYAVAAYQSAKHWSEFTWFIGMETSITHSTLNSQTEFAGQSIYDLHGRRITDTEGLKGIYIVNGKKVLVK